MIVADASVIADFLLGRFEALEAVEAAAAQGTLHAPEVVDLEVLSALRRLRRSGAVDAEWIEAAVADLERLPLTRHPHGPLRPRVWRLRDELSAYDAAYLALAELLPAGLLTADAGLAGRARASVGADRVVRVG